MLPSAGLWRAVLHRARADWPVVAAAWALLVAATTLLAAGVLYADSVATSGLRRALSAAPPADRVVTVRTYVAPRELSALGAAITGELERTLRATGGTVSQVARAGTFAEASQASGEVRDLVVLGSYAGIAAHADLVGGRWAEPGREPLEATLSEGAAGALGLAVGDTLEVVNRLGAPRTTRLTLTGIWRPRPDDGYWLGDPLELAGVQPGDPFTVRGPFVVDEADLVQRVASGDLDVTWRAEPVPGGIRPDAATQLRRDLDGLAIRLAAVADAAGQERRPAVATGLPAILDEVGRSILVSRSGVLLLTIQFAVLAGYSVLLVAGMLVERRRAEVALLRSRGATSGHLVAMAFGEALLIAVPATLVAPVLAVVIVRLVGAAGPIAGTGLVGDVGLEPTVLAVAALAGAASAVALTLPTLASGPSVAGVRAAIGRQAATTLPQRLGIDLALVVLAGIGLWQLRLYGAPLTRDARGVLGIDPLLVAAPGIGLVAGAVVAIRIVPRVAEVAERLVARRAGFVLPLGARQLARRPLRYTRAALLLMLAAALGTFAVAHAATWTRSQLDQAAYQAAADVRVVPADHARLPGWVAGSAYRGVDGVLAALPVTRQALDVGRVVRGGQLVGLDPATAARIVDLPDDESNLAGLLARLTDQRPATDMRPIPDDADALIVVVDAGMDGVEGFEELPPDAEGIGVAVTIVDGDGRLHRLAGETGLLDGTGQRLRVPLTTTVGGLDLRATAPLRLQGVEFRVQPPGSTVVAGSVAVRGVEAVGPAGTTSLDVDPSRAGWRSQLSSRGRPQPVEPVPGLPPGTVVFGAPGVPYGSLFGPVFGQSSDPAPTFRLWAGATEVAVPVIAGSSFLERAGVAVGDTVAARGQGVPLRLQIVGSTRTFPPLDPGEPFVIADAATLELVRFAANGNSLPAEEWWLDVEPGSGEAVVTALARGPIAAAEIVERDALGRSLSSDPVPLGLIGALGLGSLAALAFATVGFVVSAAVSTSERVGEFALLQALGLSGRQLSAWLSLENAFLLTLGIGAGVALGIVLAWLVLPFATLTATGAEAVPTPVVVVPWEAIVPVGVAGAAVLGVAVALVSRQLPIGRLSSVLRARDE